MSYRWQTQACRGGGAGGFEGGGEERDPSFPMAAGAGPGEAQLEIMLIIMLIRGVCAGRGGRES